MDGNAKNVFALMCLLGIIAVAVAAVLEIRRVRRGESVVTPLQFRLRMVSALIWVLVLGSTSYAILQLWPAPKDQDQAKRFISVISGVVLLLIIALLLMVYDLRLFALQRRRREAEFNQELAALAQAEIQRAQGRVGPTEHSSESQSLHSRVSPSDSPTHNGLPQ
jgi:hypothetical protein